MAKYIRNKKIDLIKVNKVNDLKDIGEAAWKFVSVFYNAGWNSLVTDTNNNSFKQKISFHCTPKVNPVKNGKLKDKNNNKLASIERLLPPIPAKTSKEINEISKFFETKVLSHANGNQDILYAQASKIGSNTENILKIKEAFPILKAKNINNIQQIIGNSKPKPQTNITTKSMFRKYVIVSMNNMNKSSTHITNINKTLKNIKTDVMVNFI